MISLPPRRTYILNSCSLDKAPQRSVSRSPRNHPRDLPSNNLSRSLMTHTDPHGSPSDDMTTKKHPMMDPPDLPRHGPQRTAIIGRSSASPSPIRMAGTSQTDERIPPPLELQPPLPHSATLMPRLRLRFAVSSPRCPPPQCPGRRSLDLAGTSS